MNFLKNISAAFKTAGGAVQSAVKVVEEKNRRTALMNRLRTVIRCEEKAEERAYLALGRYYYRPQPARCREHRYGAVLHRH